MNIPEYLDFRCFYGKRVHLGITGSIAAYKALDLLRGLVSLNCRVSVSMTESACRFVQPLSFSALGADPVTTAMFSDQPGHSPFVHLEPGQKADLMAIVPATANILAKLAHGLADDLISCQALGFQGPLVLAPAMNPRMWAAQATQENWGILKERGAVPVEPESGLVACGDTGGGRLASLENILALVLKGLSPDDMAGTTVLTTLGPTREHWDAVRFWSNPSSGIMGASLALAAWMRGAKVKVVAGPVSIDFPSEIEVVRVASAREMHEAALDLWPSCDLGCLTAAVADFRPVPHGPGKFKKADAAKGPNVKFEPNPDILADLGRAKSKGQRLIGFAAETSAPEAEMRRKLEAKNLDLIVGNRIDVSGSGFGSATNQVTILDAHGRLEQWPSLPKTEVAWRIWDLLVHP